MSTATKPATKPTSTKNESSAPTSDERRAQVASDRHDFFVAAGTMSWQLAAVVLIPVIGGFKIDEHFNTLPDWTIVGFVVAMIGMAVVVWHQLQVLSPVSSTGKRSIKEHHR